MQKILAYYGRLFATAFRPSWTITDALSTIIGLVVPLVGKFYPARELAMKDWTWQIPVAALFSVVLLRILLAPYLMFRKQDEEANDTTGQLRKELDEERQKNTFQNAPLLKGRIENLVYGDSTTDGEVFVFVLFSVLNGGSPSIAEGFRLNIKSRELDITNAPVFIPEPINLWKNGEKIGIFTPEDSLFEKIARPIERGGFVKGWMPFIFWGITSAQINSPDTTLSISFADITGQLHTVVRKSDDSGKDDISLLKPIPGATQPFTPSAKPTPNKKDQ